MAMINKNGVVLEEGKVVRMYSPAGEKATVIGLIPTANAITVRYERTDAVEVAHMDSAN